MPSIKRLARFDVLKPVYTPSADGVSGNLLVLFHGLGDTAANFAKFGVRMQLPQTAVCALTGPSPIPFFDEGTGWFPHFDDEGEGKLAWIALEGDSENVAAAQMLTATRALVVGFLAESVFESESHRDGWPAERVFLLGFAQGGAAALDAALLGTRPGADSAPLQVGGVVSIGGWLEPARYAAGALDGAGARRLAARQTRPHVLVTAGERDETVAVSRVPALVAALRGLVAAPAQVAHEVVAGKPLAMPQSAGEMRAIVRFFADHLHLRNLALEAMADVYEIKT
ncbi:hypothetical protein HK105_200118 [Polyrhizophydium stewartii]|uniref:Phospholipase/carboxylesterase/thioesterase domain-containing protein n=1 Tax=Polyrhizophydium stewartii TaxID=2732419 RepID=A0ABR4NKJ5_9FUNG